MTDKIKTMSIPGFTRVYDAIPADVCTAYVDSITGKRYQYQGKLSAVAGLAKEDTRLSGNWCPGPENDDDLTAWAILEMVIDNPAHVGLSAQPAWA